MALSVEELTERIISFTEGQNTPKGALDSIWRAICSYIEEKADVNYSWLGEHDGTADPVTAWVGKIKTGGSLSLSYSSSSDDALSNLEMQMNREAKAWIVEPPGGFALSTLLILPTIKLSKSKETTRYGAIKSVATDIIKGIKEATPTGSGSHGVYTGTSTFINIV